MHSENEGGVTISYLLLVNQDLKDIDHRKKFKDDLIVKQLPPISKEQTVDDIYDQVQKQEKISSHSKLRGWRNEK